MIAACPGRCGAGRAPEATEIALEVINALDDSHADRGPGVGGVAEPWRSTMGSSSVIGDLNQHRLLGGDTRRRAVR
jgi:hypothetical protein